jgi:hypothetical protein
VTQCERCPQSDRQSCTHPPSIHPWLSGDAGTRQYLKRMSSPLEMAGTQLGHPCLGNLVESTRGDSHMQRLFVES